MEQKIKLNTLSQLNLCRWGEKEKERVWQMISEKKKKKKLQWHLSNSGKLKLQCRSTMRAQQCAIKAECRHQEGFVLNAYHLQRKTCNARLLLNTPLFTNQAVALKSDHVTAQHFYYEYSFLHDAFAHFGKQKHWFYRFNFTLKKHPMYSSEFDFCSGGVFCMINSKLIFWRIGHRKFVGVFSFFA